MSEKLPEIDLKKSVCEIWQEKLLFDYTIEVEDEEFRVHKVIMASVSDYFKAMLTGGMVESQTDRVKLEGLDALAVSNIIEYIYTNEISGTKAKSDDLLACAVYLQIPSAIKAATQLLSREINAENCFDILLTFQSYSFKDAAERTEEYIKKHLDEALKVTDVDKLPWQSVATLVKVWNKSEWDLFLTVKQWVKVDLQNRKQLLDNILIDDFRFETLTPSQLESIKKMEIYLDGELEEIDFEDIDVEELDKTWKGRIENSIYYHDRPTHERIHFQFFHKHLPRSPCSLVAVQKNKESLDVIRKLENNNQWTMMSDAPPMPEFPNGPAAVIEVGTFLFVCGKYTGTGTQNWHVFDPQTFTWTQVASFNIPRHDFALVEAYYNLYAMGGRIGVGTDTEMLTDTIESYDFHENTWTIIPSKLPTPRHKHHACLYNNDVFVTGGWETTETLGQCSPRLDIWDLRILVKPTWIQAAPMPRRYPCHLLYGMRFNNEDVVVVVNKHFIIQYYRPFEYEWSVLDGKEHTHSQVVWRNGGTVLCGEDGNSVYFLNFYRDTVWDSDDSDDDKPSGPLSVKWTLSPNSKTITEKVLPQREDASDYTTQREIFGVLSIRQPSVDMDYN